jgi:uncharacterized protein YndB with AHSA1/START domain
MLTRAEQACLVIADISGYTSYLAGTELEHAQDVVADLMEVIIDRFEPVLTLAKLEGDAVFCYTTDAALDGSLLLDVLESTYFAFRRRVRSVRQASTCECNACSLIPTLDVKFCVHVGSVVRQRIARQEELAGGDVILAHRLLKNAVYELTGVRAYALFTSAAVDALMLDALRLGMVEHEETYEHIGAVTLFVHDMESAWRRAEESKREFLAEDRADFTVTAEIPVPATLVWEYVTTPSGYRAVSPDIIRQERHDSGRRGVGSVTHCVHGNGEQVEEILEWQPFEHFTYLITDAQMGQVRVTVELTGAEHETRVRFSVRMETAEVRALMSTPEFIAAATQYSAGIEQWFAGIRDAAVRSMAARAQELDATALVRLELTEASGRYWQTVTAQP